MGAVLGLVFGIGLLLMWRSGSRRPPPRRRTSPSISERTTELLAQAGYASIGAHQLFAEDYRATGRFGDCLDRLKKTLADPVADRLIESLRVAREVGGTDLGRLLRTLSQFLREDARTRAELETRQGWTVNAARLALCAPWAVRGMLALPPATVVASSRRTV